MSSEPAPAPSRRLDWTAFAARLVGAHFSTYPVVIGAAFALMPAVMKFREAALLHPEPGGAKTKLMQEIAAQRGFSATEAAQVEAVLLGLLWPTVAIALLVHLASVPWAVSALRRRDERLTRRIFVVTMAASLAVVVLGGVLGWGWLLTL